MWHELILRLAPEVEAADPAPVSAVDAIESGLGQGIPEDLRALLLEFNGALDIYGTDIVWTAERILEDNSAFRGNPAFVDLYSSFDDMVFFGDNGGGDQFAFTRGRDGVFVWDHETDERYRVADSLEQYLVSCLESDGEDWYRAGSTE